MWKVTCAKCGNKHYWNKPCSKCNEANNLPADYEPCGQCGFDHAYEQAEARKWHLPETN